MNNPLVQPDPGLFIWTIVTFLVLLALLAKFAWRPLLEALETRQERSASRSTTRSRRSRSSSGCSRSRRRSSREARVEAEAIITQSRADADRLREEMRQKARAEADGIVKNAERQIQLETAPRAAADPARGGRPVGDDRVEDHPAQPVEGRQRAADRRRAQAGRKPPQLGGSGRPISGWPDARRPKYWITARMSLFVIRDFPLK